MADIPRSIKNVQGQAEQKVRQAGPWVERMARLGYAAKGIVYIVIGFLAIEAAFTSGGKTTNSQGALISIAEQPFGQFLIALVGFGLAGYALWRLVQGALDVEHKGNEAKGIFTRLGYIISGVSYGVLAYTAFQLLMGHAVNTDGNRSTQDWTARLMAVPFGQWLVGIVGLVVIGVGIKQFIQGCKADFGDILDVQKMSANHRNIAVQSGRMGYCAIGIVYTILGGFLVQAAWNANPKQAKGVGSALALLSQQPYGAWVLGIVALGLMGYGVFMLVEARYRAIKI